MQSKHGPRVSVVSIADELGLKPGDDVRLHPSIQMQVKMRPALYTVKSINFPTLESFTF